MRFRVLLLFIIASALIGACGGTTSADTPPDIRYGQDVAECGMIISDPRFAAGMTQPGQDRFFVDVGELVAAAQADGLGTGHAWVHDYDSQVWLEAPGAFYVVSSSLRTITPMGSGVIAFKSRENGESFLSGRDGIVMTWDEIMSQWRMPGAMPAS